MRKTISEPVGRRFFGELSADIRAAVALLEAVAPSDPRYQQAQGALLSLSPKGRKLFMRVFDDRSADIRDALRRELNGGSMAWMLLFDVIETLPLEGQRMTITQAELARRVGVSAPQASRSFALLAKVGAVLLREPSGKSVTWEVDAEFATRQTEAKRLEACMRQAEAKRRELAQRAPKRRGEVVRPAFRVVDDPEGSAVIHDPRQRSLIGDAS